MRDPANVCVKKIGNVCKVYVDTGTNNPLPLNSYDDTPAGGFPRTFSSPGECQAFYRGRKLVFFEKKASGNQTVVKPVDQKVLQLELNKLGPAKDTSDSPAVILAPVVENSPALIKSKEYLDMLVMACRYASKDNKEILLIKMETVEELIKHVFKT